MYKCTVFISKVIIIAILVPFLGWSQDIKNNSYNNGINLQPVFTLNNDFNLQDWYTGFSGGVEDIGYQWGAKLSIGFRPFRKKVQLQEDNDIVRQFRERKTFISIDIDKRFAHFDLFGVHTQFFVGTKNGVLLGAYSGTRKNAEPVWVIAPFGGVCFNFNDRSFAKIGYMFLNDKLLNVDNNRISLTFSFLMSHSQN